MAEHADEGESMAEQIPDRFEIALRRRTTEEKWVELAHEVTQEYDLDPALAEAVEDACREDDLDAVLQALTDFLRAMREAKGLL
jgi:hypothetical protein